MSVYHSHRYLPGNGEQVFGLDALRRLHFVELVRDLVFWLVFVFVKRGLVAEMVKFYCGAMMEGSVRVTCKVFPILL